MIKIKSIKVDDIRFPTSKDLTGSDAVHTDPDYSATYVTIHTSDSNLRGYGIAFTIGKGNDIVAECVRNYIPLFIGLSLEEAEKNIGKLWFECVDHSQLRWLGPEKGVVHMAVAAIFNAFWDLISKMHKKPLWKFVVESDPEKIMSWLTFKYIEDVMTKDDAYKILTENQKYKKERTDIILKEGYPSYTTAAGWLGYSNEKIVDLCKQYMEKGWRHFKIKVGLNLEEDVKRLEIIRNTIGDDCFIMVDANQQWSVNQSIKHINAYKKFNLLFVSCRLGSINEILTVLLMAHKFNVPVFPHAGGVGLCEYVQHLCMIDYVLINGEKNNKVVEYQDSLHEHFKYPCNVKNGKYMPPLDHGYSIEMKEESVKTYSYPKGEYWSSII